VRRSEGSRTYDPGAGIALPGMPAGSPGMGGEKSEPFVVYAIGGDRSGEVFESI